MDALQVERANAMYPGRASMSPLLDLLITLLHWGAEGWRAQLAAREALFAHTHAALTAFAAAHGERVLHTPGNPISLALTLDTLLPLPTPADDGQPDDGQPAQAGAAARGEVTFLGAMLFARCASGARVVAPGKVESVAGLEFRGYGAHCDAYPHAYLTVAAALGTSPSDVDEFLRRLGACLGEHRRRAARRAAAAAAAPTP
jgi:O-phospho-L-seryl-tRNASec:L-selenocysteinyl-tRNA synthase